MESDLRSQMNARPIKNKVLEEKKTSFPASWGKYCL